MQWGGSAEKIGPSGQRCPCAGLHGGSDPRDAMKSHWAVWHRWLPAPSQCLGGSTRVGREGGACPYLERNVKRALGRVNMGRLSLSDQL